MRAKGPGYKKPWVVEGKKQSWYDVRRCVSRVLSGSEEKINPSPCREEEEGDAT